jgi:hypothetical protein
MTEFKPRPIRYKELECNGDGFTFANHSRADSKTIAKALQGMPPVLEQLSKNRRKSWWGAQVRLYGLKGKDWSIDVCRAVLREALDKGTLKVPPALVDTEERMKKEYFVQREKDIENHKKMVEEEKRKIIEKDEKFRAASTDEEKVKIDVRRFLEEKFGSDDVTFVVIPYHYFYGVDAIVRQLKLFSARPIWNRRLKDNIVVVAITEKIALRERDRIDREMQEQTIAMEQEKWDTLNKKRLDLISVDGNAESPTGHWALHMPELYDNNCWEHSDGECIIELPSFNPSEEYAYAEFKFVQIKGYFKIHVGKDTEKWQGVELKVDWEGWGDDDGGEYDLETQHVASIMFTSASECCGTIDGWFGPWKFKGVKVSHETEVTAEKCQEEYESAKKTWDGYRAEYNEDEEYPEDDEDESMDEEEDESMDEVKLEPAEAEGTLPAMKQEEEH